jgi:hypothetical protein
MIFPLAKMREIVESYKRGVSMSTIIHNYRNLPHSKHFQKLMER